MAIQKLFCCRFNAFQHMCSKWNLTSTAHPSEAASLDPAADKVELLTPVPSQEAVMNFHTTWNFTGDFTWDFTGDFTWDYTGTGGCY